jgi:hypothetical protein
MKRTENCNHCGECCGGPNAGDELFMPWPSYWPDALNEWSKKSLSQHILHGFMLLPQESGHRGGTVYVDGTPYVYQWVPGKGLCKSYTELQCPFLLPYKDQNTGRCGLFGTSKHYIFARHCKDFPPVEAEMSTIVKIFSQIPSCVHEYIEED